MTNENIDPVYKYIDKKISSVKKELRQLKVAHDAIAGEHTQTLLELQRMVAILKVISDVDFICSVIDSQLHGNATMRSQVIADASAIKAQITTSNNPIHLSANFNKKWMKTLRNLGAEIISY